jgi:hypothetical protein
MSDVYDEERKTFQFLGMLRDIQGDDRGYVSNDGL